MSFYTIHEGVHLHYVCEIGSHLSEKMVDFIWIMGKQSKAKLQSENRSLTHSLTLNNLVRVTTL